MIYYCFSDTCKFPGEGRFKLDLPAEACIDEHNCAVVFCPHCRGRMTLVKPGEPDPRKA